MAEVRNLGDITVNDGNGLFDNIGLCETLIMDLNRLPKFLIDNQFIAVCDLIAKMGQKLNNLKNGIQKDLEAKDQQIEELKVVNDRLVEQITGLPVINDKEKDGDGNE